MNHKIARIAMVDNQIRPADVTNYELLGSFLAVPRESFVPADFVELAYAEHELQIAPARKMMSVRGFAKLAQALSLKKNDDILVIGAGMGYELAVLAPLVKSIVAVENEPSLLDQSGENLKAHGIANVQIVKGELQAGSSKKGGYDAILFCGAIAEIPSKIAKQLSPNGRMIAIIESENVFSAMLSRNVDGQMASELLFNASAPRLPGFEKKSEFSFV